MNPEHCSLTGKHVPIPNQSWFQCRWCHKKMEGNTVVSPQVKFVDTDALFKETVQFYLKKNYSLDRCNEIAKSVVEKYLQKNQIVLLEKDAISNKNSVTQP